MSEARPHAWRLAGLAALLLVAGLARVHTLEARYLVEGDGAIYAALARQAAAGDLGGLTNSYWSNLWPAVILATSTLTGLDEVGAGRLASLAAGLLLIPVTGALAGRLAGPRAAVFGALAAAAHPWLQHFSTLVFTESLFALLLTASVLSLWDAATQPGRRAVWQAAALIGAALLTRPEAAALAALGTLSLLVIGSARLGRREAGFRATAIVLCAVLTIGARALAIHHVAETWDFGGLKGFANLLVGLARDDAEMEQIVHSVTESGESRLTTNVEKESALSFVLRHKAVVARHVFDNLGKIARCATRVYPPAPVSLGAFFFMDTRLGIVIRGADWAALALAMAGVAVPLWRRKDRAAPLFVSANLLVYLAGLSPLLIHERLVLAPVPLFLALLAAGLSHLVDALSGRLRLAAVTTATALLLALVPAGAVGIVTDPDPSYAFDWPVQREAGLWLHSRYPTSMRLMTISAAISYYFYDGMTQGNEVDFPWGPYPAFVDFARRSECDLVAAAEWHLEAARFPVAVNLKPDGDHPGLEYVGTIGSPPPFRVHVFRVERPPAPPDPEVDDDEAAGAAAGR